MAEETPQQTPAPTGGGESGGEQHAQAAASGGLASYLPLGIVILLMPVIAWGLFEIKSRMDKKHASAPASEAEQTESAKPEKKEAKEAAKSESSHGGAKDEKGKKKKKETGKRDTRLPIPLTRDAVAYHPADTGKEGDTDKIVILDLKGEPRDEAKSDKIVVNIASTGGSRFAVMRVSLVGELSNLIELINQNRERMLDVASGTLSSYSPDDIEKLGFRGILRSQLMAEFNRILGRGALQEILITEFVIQ